MIQTKATKESRQSLCQKRRRTKKRRSQPMQHPLTTQNLPWESSQKLHRVQNQQRYQTRATSSKSKKPQAIICNQWQMQVQLQSLAFRAQDLHTRVRVSRTQEQE